MLDRGEASPCRAPERCGVRYGVKGQERLAIVAPSCDDRIFIFDDTDVPDEMRHIYMDSLTVVVL